MKDILVNWEQWGIMFRIVRVAHGLACSTFKHETTPRSRGGKEFKYFLGKENLAVQPGGRSTESSQN